MANDGNVDRALDALFAHGGDMSHGGAPSASAPPTPAINEALVSQLTDMGFPRDRAIHALEATVSTFAIVFMLLNNDMNLRIITWRPPLSFSSLRESSFCFRTAFPSPFFI